MLYLIQNRLSLMLKLQYIFKSIKRGFLKSESYLDDIYQREYDEVALEYFQIFDPEQYKVALERLALIDSDIDELRSILGSIIYGGLKSIFILAVVTPAMLVHHVFSESIRLLSGVLNFFVNNVNRSFQVFSTPTKPEGILFNTKANYISRAKKEDRANPSNDRHICFELPEPGNKDPEVKYIDLRKTDKYRVKGMLYKMRMMLNHGKELSLESMKEADLVPTLQQYREYPSSWELHLSGANSLILAGRLRQKI